MLEQAGQQCFVLRQRNNAVTDIPWRKHVELFAQASAGAAVVTDCNHGAKLTDYWLDRFSAGTFDRKGNEVLEAFQQGGQAGTASNRHDAQPTTRRFFAPYRVVRLLEIRHCGSLAVFFGTCCDRSQLSSRVGIE